VTVRSSNANGTSVDYAWDAANQLASVTDNRAGGMTVAAYTPTGRPATLTQPNGVAASYSYDNLDRVTSLAWHQGASPNLASWAYTHNMRGQRTGVTDATSRHVAYGYDANARLISETISDDPRGTTFNGALGYTLDSVGNRLTRTSTLATLGAQAFGYDANDQLTSDGYDANGNTTSSGTDTYAYDSQKRLVSKTGPAGTVTVVYDCDGNRVAKTVGGATTRYLVDDLNPTGYVQVLEELDGGAVQTRHTYGSAVVSQTRDIASTAATSYFGYDAHGNVAFLTDASGVVTDAYDYDAWGTVVASVGSTPNTRLYAGEEFDPDVGLINLRARQYKPGAGRFTTIDPLMGDVLSPTSFNRYLYASSDPINVLDPMGLASLFEYNIQIGPRVYSVALHPAHHAWTFFGYKLFCVHLQLLTYLSGVSGSASRIQIPILPFCRP
jgi:RHS repeat-associated protein